MFNPKDCTIFYFYVRVWFTFTNFVIICKIYISGYFLTYRCLKISASFFFQCYLLLLSESQRDQKGNKQLLSSAGSSLKHLQRFRMGQSNVGSLELYPVLLLRAGTWLPELSCCLPESAQQGLGWTAEHPGCLLQDVDSSLDPVPAPSKWPAGETLSSLLIVFGHFIKTQLIKKK